ncbi:MAG: CPBP family intramembrane glutamic endopeptidase [Myxococcota bacterium]|nr:CPBP family intramembrane glutamic endopeptidase [Myxococcota bacterium]
MAETRPRAAAAIAATAVATLAVGAGLARERPLDAEWLALAGTIASLSFAALAVMGAFLVPAPPRDTLALVRPRDGAPSLSLLLAGQLGFGVMVSAGLAWTGVVEGSSLEQLDQAMAAAALPALALLAIGVALLPGIAEELLFRGLLLGALLRRIGAPAAIALSTLPFALLHLDPAHILGAGALGLYLAGVRVTTGSTLACILCHVANNALAIALSTQSWPGWIDWIVLPLASLFAVAGLLGMRRAWPAPSVAADGRPG